MLAVTNIIPKVKEEGILWLLEEPLVDWIDIMKNEGAHEDQYSLQILATIVKQDILYNVHTSSCKVIQRRPEILRYLYCGLKNPFSL